MSTPASALVFSLATLGMAATAPPGISDDVQRDALRASPYIALLEQDLGSLLTHSEAASSDCLGYALALDGETALVGGYGRDGLTAYNDGAAYVYVRQAGIWTLQATLQAADPVFGAWFGYAVALQGDTALIGAPGGGDPANNSGAAYVFVRDGATWTQQARLVSDDAAVDDRFGVSVALDGDQALVGAARRGDGDEGAAYHFSRSGTTWAQQARLVAPNAQGASQFGASVSLRGGTAAVGAPYAPGPLGQHLGAVYVFEHLAGAWTFQAELGSDESGDEYHSFGNALALSGETLLVGARYVPSEGALNQGAAYVFVRNGATWSRQAKLLAADGEADESFGVSVALAQDTALIGALWDDGWRGAAYLFERSGTTWTQANKLTAPSPRGGDVSGSAVALSGDAMLIGAYGWFGLAGWELGAAFALRNDAGAWTHEAKLGLADDGDLSADDYFGQAVAMSGDRVVVGAFHDCGPVGGDQGSAYVFERAGETWTRQAKLTNDFGWGEFGASVAIDGDTLVVGAPWEDTLTATAAGAIYVFVREGGQWIQQARLTAEDATESDLLGWAVALSGDTLMADAIYAPAGGVNFAGAVYVFTRDAATWSQTAKLVSEAPRQNGSFGMRLALQGDTALIAAPGDDDPFNPGGAAYVFVRSGADWVRQARLAQPDPSCFDFGASVALDGGQALIGAPGDALGEEGGAYGSAFIFARSAGTWTQQAKLVARNPGFEDYLGGTVALSGDIAVACASGFDGSAGVDQGGAFLFVRSGSLWSQRAVIEAPAAAEADGFGSGIALAGGLAVIGAAAGDYPGPGVDAGRAYALRLGPDCNANGIFDPLDISNGTSQDVNSNGVPDECEGPVTVGDMNCDGVLNTLDINPFVLALSDPAGYAAAFPDCTISHADVNADGFVDVLDINPFVLLLSGA
ncbi:hypothetical protein RAS1_16210 [Phycisphaerae bacterium RAS1]|nr:hypothetical protein RAS1_16210 [Phycisphaerae bacterium RAS1]